MSNQKPQERTDPVDELDERMTDESAEPGMSYTIEYDDDTDSADAGADDTAAADPEAIAAAADDAGTGDEEAEAVANTAAAALDETLHAGAGTTSTDKPSDADSTDDVDDSVFRAYPMFSMRGVTVADAKTGEHIWNDLTMRCEAGTSYGVLVDAHNTRQHDTLVALMAGFAHPAEGSVMTKSTPLHDLTPLELRGHRIGVLLQQFALRGDLSAAANLEYAMDASNRNYLKPIAVLAQELLTRVGFAPRGDDNATQAERSRALVRTLGAVDRVRVMVARAIATDPDIVLADEPTATLDEADAATILDLLRAQVHGESKQRTVIVVTTDPHVAGAMDETIDLTH
ncbi:ATP-binding cassette domain-containing protein [Bifidobacterium pseudolongum]|uniref:ATP-binding cassette domain-containing protein n=1 Tax=Bifidobacterium pseudolongum TaxID=1694 RepID=A0A395XEV6_9BIFI|nr:ATP-binding cassette domain-containing protein [Bifidobacterium pseudolongum]RGW07790.1 ATP-binding cassette domain-containing protein [Bifidobacterium pseudolongum]